MPETKDQKGERQGDVGVDAPPLVRDTPNATPELTATRKITLIASDRHAFLFRQPEQKRDHGADEQQQRQIAARIGVEALLRISHARITMLTTVQMASSTPNPNNGQPSTSWGM